ncbi:hypothetical protein [Roseibium marinum]|uniref:Uncharacterized protein n=1 Tax=Roseibium marinum TaxID=281252 RepID=A0A2S3UZ78_9HYPH|nr:hypothetical protein [Roseibium marinum]POF32769.1 hypothetical protein CLV41_102174 [Roseibium marinum]
MPGPSRREFLLGGAASLAAFAAGSFAAGQAQAADHALTLAGLDHRILPETLTRG